MALNKQNFTLQMGQGVDTKTDPKQVVAGKLITLENATFQSTNRLTKRPGTSELSASAPLSAGNAIQSFQGELVAMDGNNLKSYATTTDSFISKGTKLAIDLSVSSVVKNSYEQKGPDSAINGNVALYAWEQYSGTVLDSVGYSIVDVSTGQVLNQAKLAAGTSKPKVVDIGAYLVLFYVDGTTLKAQAFNSASPLSAPTSFTVDSLNSAGVYDVAEVIIGSAYDSVIVAYTDATNAIKYRKVDGSFVVGVAQTYSANAIDLAVFVNTAATAVRVMFYDGTAVQVLHNTFPLGSQSGPYTIETIANVANITGIFTGATTCQYFYEINNTVTNLTADNYIRTNTITGTSVGTASDFMRSVCLWSKPWTMGGINYICALHDSPLQATYFVFDFAKNTVAKIAPGNGGGQSSNRLLREVNPLSSNAFQMAYLIKDLVESVNGDVYTQTGVNSVTMTIQTALVSESLGNNLNVSGGILSAYDGQTVAEQNFNLYPENVSIAGSGTGGTLSNASYQYTATYEWTDAQGQVHISTPSVPVTVDFSKGPKYFLGTYAPGSVGSTYPFNVAGTTSVGDKYASSGDEISGPGIPVGSYIVDGIQYAFTSTSSASAVSVRGWIYQSPTSSATGQVVNLTGKKITTYDATINSATVTVFPCVVNQHGFTIDSATVYNITTPSGTAPCYRATIDDPTSIQVGMAIEIPNTIFGYLWAVKKIDGNKIYFCRWDFPTVLTPLPVGYQNTKSVLFYVRMDAVVGSGVSTVTFTYPVDAGFTFFIGQRVVSTGFYVNPNFRRYATITNVSYPAPGQVTLTFDIPYYGASPSSSSFYFSYTPHWIKTGQTWTATTGFSGSVKIVSVSTNHQVTFDQVSIATGNGQISSDQINIAQISIPTLRVTDKPVTTPVSIAVYRTLANQSLFYRISSFTSPLLNDKTVDYLTFSDTVSDAQLIGNEQLYTTGGVLENTAAPALTQLTQYKNRLIGISSEDPYTWYFSKPIGTNIPVQFTPYFYKKIPELGGPMTALGVMDDKLLFFKRSSIFLVSGTGPNNLGLQDDFNDAELITTDTGCIEPKSIVRMPLGLMYKSGKGIYLIDRGLNVRYVGAAVEAYNANVVTAAELIENVNQVRFTLDSGVALVYDYYFEQWSVFTNVNAKDTCLFQTKFTYIRPDGKIYKETPSVWTDGGLPIYLRLVTSWMSLNGLQGFERLYNLMVLGDYKSPHTLTAKIRHDFSDTVNQTTALPIASDPGVYQFKVYLTRQKTDALQIELAESQSGPTYGEGLDISAVTMQVGVKSGTNKLPAGKLYG